MPFARSLLGFLAGAAILVGGIGAVRGEDAKDAAAVYIVTYFEVAPSSAKEAAALLRPMAAASRKEDGNAGVDVLEEIGRPNRFAIIEAWRSKAALDAHAAQAGAARDQLQALLVSPFDVRPSTGLATAAPAAPAGSAAGKAVYVVTHVDVVPTAKDQALQLLHQLVADGRKADGNLSFELLQQNSRPNHFTLVEAWRDRKALDAWAMAAPKRDFRQKLQPLQGALFDERFYLAVG